MVHSSLSGMGYVHGGAETIISAFTEALIVTPLSDGKSWGIVSEFDYNVGVEDSAQCHSYTHCT